MASSTPMEAALKEVGRLFREGTHSGLPDDRLLGRFLARRDEAAFATLVERHGPMVLRTALDVLRDPGIAEDAFQATFLTLARRGGSIRGGESVGAWLHRVAHRAALRLNAREARRRREERAAVAAAPPTAGRDSRGDAERDELRAAIHAEVERLPERYRRPVVLCLIQGVSQPEAAIQLGISEGAVRGRLARARAVLRDRLARRGLAPAALPAPIGLAVPPAWVETAVVAARAAAAGRWRAFGWVATPALIRQVVAMAVAGGVVMVAALAAAPVAPRLPSATSPAVVPAQGKEVAARPEEKPAVRTVAVRGRVLGPAGKPVTNARIYLIPDYRFHATPVASSDPDGTFRLERPEEAFRPDPHNGIPPSWPAVLVATADGFGTDWYAVGDPVAGGRTSPMLPEYEKDFHLPGDRPIGGRVVDSRGRPVAEASVEVREIGVPPDLKWGPILDDLRALKNVLPPNRTWSTVVNPWSVPFVPATETDDDGRFRLTGLGRDRLVILRVRGPGTMPTEFSVVNRDDVDDLTRAIRAKYPPAHHPEGVNARANADPGALLFGPTPLIEVGPARTYGGTVRGADSGEPLAEVGLFVAELNAAGGWNYGSGQANSGPDGRYRGVREAGSPTIWVTAVPDWRGDYLPASRRLDGVEPMGEAVADFRLTRGTIIKGRVTEAASGRPIVASLREDCHTQGLLQAGFVHYFPLANNAILRDSPTGLYFAGDPQGQRIYTSAMIDGEGTFRILVPPGPGVLLVMASPGISMFGVTDPVPGVDYAGRTLHRLFPYAKLRSRSPNDGAQAAADLSSLPGLAGAISLATYNAYRVIDPQVGAREMSVGITVDRPASRLLQFVDLDGRPVRGVTIRGLLGPGLPPASIEGSEAEATVLEPGRPREALALSHDGRLYARATIAAAAGPLTVRLGPAASVVGRLVDHAGRPLANWVGSLYYGGDALESDIDWGDRTPKPIAPIATDADGRFRVPGIVPGLRASVSFREPAPSNVQPVSPAVRDLTLRPGEVRDVGTIKAGSLKP